jgi:MFS family permease
MLGSVPLLLSIRGAGRAPHGRPGMLRELREGWSEFRSHTWLWAIVAQFCVTLMAWYGAFEVLGPVVAKEHLGGPAAWGAITAAESAGLIVGGLASLRFGPRRPMLFVVLIGASMAISPLSLAMLWPLPVICVFALGLGAGTEAMMVQWTVALTRNIPAEKLARVFAYDAVGSVLAMPAGALAVGPVAASIGVPATQYGAAAMIIVAAAFALIPRDVRTMRTGGLPRQQPLAVASSGT